jgi:hypothetical protein
MSITPIALMTALTVATPFTDTRGRFQLDLPNGWQFAPQPGDVTGAAFQRKLGDEIANFAVRVTPVSDTTTLAEFVRRLSSSITSDPSYSLVNETTTQLAGLTVLKRRYTLALKGAKGSSELVKLAEDAFSVQAGVGYVVHAETMEDSWAKFAGDFERLTASLRFSSVDPNTPSPFPKELCGRWLMSGTTDTIFELRSDGTFDLAGTTGAWRVSGDKMMTQPVGGGREVFVWRLVNGELEVTNENLGGSIRYRRFDGALPLESLPKPTLTGVWKAKKHKLEIKGNKEVVLDGVAGTYTEADGLLIMRLGKNRKQVVAGYLLNGNKLTLTQDRFGSGMTFDRQ